MSVFYHERLPVYERALRFAVRCNQIALTLPQYRQDLNSQLWRASTSVPFNIAEGTGGHTSAMRIHHFRIARGSAAECSSIFDYITGSGLLDAEQLPYQDVRDVAVALGSSIYKHL